MEKNIEYSLVEYSFVKCLACLNPVEMVRITKDPNTDKFRSVMDLLINHNLVKEGMCDTLRELYRDFFKIHSLGSEQLLCHASRQVAAIKGLDKLPARDEGQVLASL